MGLAPRLDRLEKNLIINGAFDFWQRGTTFVSPVNNTYTVDRFIYHKAGTATHTISRDTDVPTFEQSGFKSLYSMRLNLTTPDTSIAANDLYLVQHNIEGHNFRHIARKPFVLSFWVKATLTGVYCISLRNSNGDRNYLAEYTILASNVWQRVEIPVPASTESGGWDYETGYGLQVGFILACGTAEHGPVGGWNVGGNYKSTANQVNGVNTGATDFRIAQVMLHEGIEPVPFQRAGFNIGDELKLCQRYYEKSYQLHINPGTSTIFGRESYVSSNAGFFRKTVSYKVRKRSDNPTVFIWSETGVADTSSRDGGATTALGSVVSSQRGFTAQGAGHTVNAEYSFQWAADAEL